MDSPLSIIPYLIFGYCEWFSFILIWNVFDYMFRIILNQLHVSLGIVTQLSASWHESRVPTLYSSIWHIHIKLSQSITFYSQQYITVLGFYEGFSSLSSLSFFSLSISYRFKKSYLGIPVPGFLVSLNILNPISNQTILQQN